MMLSKALLFSTAAFAAVANGAAIEKESAHSSLRGLQPDNAQGVNIVHFTTGFASEAFDGCLKEDISCSGYCLLGSELGVDGNPNKFIDVKCCAGDIPPLGPKCPGDTGTYTVTNNGNQLTITINGQGGKIIAKLDSEGKVIDDETKCVGGV